MQIRKRTIKIRKKNLYSDYINIVEIRVLDGESTKLVKILYISKFKINLLSNRKFYKSELKETWDRNGLYFYNNLIFKIIGVIKHGGVYIINKIITRFAESIFNIFIYAYYYISKFKKRVSQIPDWNNPASKNILLVLLAPEDPSETDKNISEKNKIEYNL